MTFWIRHASSGISLNLCTSASWSWMIQCLSRSPSLAASLDRDPSITEETCVSDTHKHARTKLLWACRVINTELLLVRRSLAPCRVDDGELCLWVTRWQQPKMCSSRQEILILIRPNKTEVWQVEKKKKKKGQILESKFVSAVGVWKHEISFFADELAGKKRLFHSSLQAGGWT